jgi:predicted DNA-binding transcriptional regulator AlpA
MRQRHEEAQALPGLSGGQAVSHRCPLVLRSVSVRLGLAPLGEEGRGGVSAEVIPHPALNEQCDLTKSELAKLWRMSERWIEKQMNDEQDPLPHRHRGRKVFFRLADVEAWEQRRQP